MTCVFWTICIMRRADTNEKDGKKKLKWYMDEVSYKIANVYRESGPGTARGRRN